MGYNALHQTTLMQSNPEMQEDEKNRQAFSTKKSAWAGDRRHRSFRTQDKPRLESRFAKFKKLFSSRDE